MVLKWPSVSDTGEETLHVIVEIFWNTELFELVGLYSEDLWK